ncbi:MULTISPECIES: hypothetical protein [unclassified Asaia]|uniref:hypothetical protein n=1 Tax=unclassified Asaia TaxID=2685023 RepID=UPI0013151629|nr:hypothetical protein [Asaia sp. W19]
MADQKAYNALHPLVLDAQAGASVTSLEATEAQAAVSAFYSYLATHNIGGVK